MRKPVEQFQDRLARLFPEEHGLGKDSVYRMSCGKDQRKLARTVTFQVTDACNLKCTYCYQINKCTHVMSIDVAKRFFDMLLSATPEDEYINPENAPGLIIEFIGGEPFLQIDLISEITDYCIYRMIETGHPWAKRFMISICSNGVLYFDPKVQEYINKHKEYLSFSISIDGNKELHDSCRVFPDGSGSYDIAIAGVKHFREFYNGYMGSKMTLAPSNIRYAYDAVSNLIEIGYKDIHLNCVYEEGWTNEDATVLYYQLKKIADYLLADREKFDNIYLSIFDEFMFKPKSVNSNENWCGGNGAMISCDWKGDIYPCIRYMESSLGKGIDPVKIGNVYEGVMKTPETVQIVRKMRSITRRSQSNDECFYCPIADGCSWCSAYNYQMYGTVDKRATFICPMHKARALANAYLWNSGNRKWYPDRRFIVHIPKAWATEIISEEEYDMLIKQSEYTLEDAKYAYEFYKDSAHKPMEDTTIRFNDDETVSPHYTNLPEYSYDDIIDMNKQICNHNEDGMKDSPLFQQCLGLLITPSLREIGVYDNNGHLNEDKLNAVPEDIMNSIIQNTLDEYRQIKNSFSESSGEGVLNHATDT